MPPKKKAKTVSSPLSTTAASDAANAASTMSSGKEANPASTQPSTRLTRASTRLAAAAAAAAAVSLPNLPAEMIVHIYRAIPENEFATRNALVRTSRLFHDYFNYDLYSSAVNTRHRIGCWELPQWAAAEGKVATLQRLLSYSLYLPPACNFFHTGSVNTPLLLAVVGNKYECVRVLLAYGADVNELNHIGSSVLYHAPGAKMVHLLLDAGADINLTNRLGSTALHRAAQWGRKTAMSALLKRGADPSRKDTSGETAGYYWDQFCSYGYRFTGGFY